MGRPLKYDFDKIKDGGELRIYIDLKKAGTVRSAARQYAIRKGFEVSCYWMSDHLLVMRKESKETAPE